MLNIGVDLPGGLPHQLWLAAIVKERTDEAENDPQVRCLPDNLPPAYGLTHSTEVRPQAWSLGGAP
jgi:hypothetical protein